MLRRILLLALVIAVAPGCSTMKGWFGGKTKGDEPAKLKSPHFAQVVDELRGDIAIAKGNRDEARKNYESALGRLDEAAPTRPLLELKLIDTGGQPPAKPET